MPSVSTNQTITSLGRIGKMFNQKNRCLENVRDYPREQHQRDDEERLADHGFDSGLSIGVPHSGHTPETLPVRL